MSRYATFTLTPIIYFLSKSNFTPASSLLTRYPPSFPNHQAPSFPNAFGANFILNLRLLDCLQMETNIEIHIGTDTPVGDPIEVDAVGRCFSPREGPPLLIGSVSIKSSSALWPSNISIFQHCANWSQRC